MFVAAFCIETNAPSQATGRLSHRFFGDNTAGRLEVLKCLKELKKAYLINNM